MVKKLRYYARFIVVCLLLNKRQVLEIVRGRVSNWRPLIRRVWLAV